jgi:hypothetical protein
MPERCQVGGALEVSEGSEVVGRRRAEHLPILPSRKQSGLTVCSLRMTMGL